MAFWNALLEVEKVKQPALIAALPTHHDPAAETLNETES
jgi:hypothetical protein